MFLKKQYAIFKVLDRLFFQKYLIFQKGKENEIDENVLKKIKSEYVTKNKISNDIYTDCGAAKILFQCLCRAKTFLGFVQEIHQNPFGLLLISEIQVKKTYSPHYFQF